MGPNRNHQLLSSRKLEGKESSEISTLFVDNIPEERDPQWLFKIFNKYEVVKDAFIPRKRSLQTSSRFGFVWFDWHVSAGMAVAKLNGVWFDDKKLFVKEACFDVKEGKEKTKIPNFNGH